MVKIDPTKQISAVSLKVDKDDGYIQGIRFISDDLEDLCDEDFIPEETQNCCWITEDLEDFETIIGVGVDKSHDRYLRLAFVIGSATEPKAAAAESYDTSGTWRPKVCDPVCFGKSSATFNQRSLKSNE